MLKLHRTGQLKALGIAFGAVGIFLISQLIVSFVITAISYTDASVSAYQLFDNIPLISLISDILAVAVILVIHACRHTRPLREVELRKVGGLQIVFGIVLGILSVVAVTAFFYFIPEDASIMQEYNDASSSIGSGGFLINLISVVIVAPISEEIIMRGTVLKYLRRSFHPVPAVLISAVLFGLLHGQPLWMAYAAMIGILMGVIYMKTDSIIPTIALHMTFNFLGGFSFDASLPLGVVIPLFVVAVAAIVVIVVKLVRKKQPVYPYNNEIIRHSDCSAHTMIDIYDMCVTSKRASSRLSHVNLRVFQSDSVGLIGNQKNAAALVQTLYGIVSYCSGTVQVGEHELEQQSGALARHMGYLTPIRTFLRGTTPVQAVQQTCRAFLNPSEIPVYTNAVLERYGLLDDSNTPVENLDHGKLTLLSLILGICCDPEIVFFVDSGEVRDAATASLVKMVLGDLRSRGKTILIASAHENLIRQFCIKTALLENGTVTVYGHTEDVFSFLRARQSPPSGNPVLGAFTNNPVSENSPAGDF